MLMLLMMEVGIDRLILLPIANGGHWRLGSCCITTTTTIRLFTVLSGRRREHELLVPQSNHGGWRNRRVVAVPRWRIARIMFRRVATAAAPRVCPLMDLVMKHGPPGHQRGGHG